MIKKSNTISANTVFHFTKNLSNLKNILKHGFYPHYCVESWELYFNNKKALAVPIICFCDIPLSQIKDHIFNYGYYAIGLTKNWAIKNKVSPVLYSYKDSDLINCLSENLTYATNLNDVFIKAAQKIKNNKNIIDTFSSLLTNAIRTFSYMKPYEGNKWEDGKFLKKTIRFYDEREWRFVPIIKPNKKKDNTIPYPFLDSSTFQFKKLLEEANSKLVKYKLAIAFSDIKYLIIKSENEIPKLINIIEHMIDTSFSKNQINILKTKILTVEQIVADF